MYNKITKRHEEHATQSCTMEPIEDRLLMASDYLRPADYEATMTTGSTATFTMTVTTSSPSTGILIGLLLPAIQKMPS